MAGIYIHIPYCKKACHYCNFHFSTTRYNDDQMMDCIEKEAVLRKDYVEEDIETIYFGGGTPSILPPDIIASLIDTITRHYKVAANPEITLESNPDDILPAPLKAWRAAGINRLSIGVQSFKQADLTWMNRAHNSDQSLQAIQDSQDAGFENITIDLIYGTPFLSDQHWQENLRTVESLGVPHLSAYALTVEKQTALYKMIEKGKIPPIDQQKQTTQFDQLMDWAADHEFDHYEISNFATKGYRSRHNSSYWHSIPYLGLGPSAHSFNGSTRRWNIANNQLYIQNIQNGTPDFETETLSRENKINERIMINLRLQEGLNLTQMASIFGHPEKTRVLIQAEEWLASSHLTLLNDHLILTRKGKHFADAIAADLFV